MKTQENCVIITIDQDYDSGGVEVAALLSEQLGISSYAKEILTEAAKQSRIPEELLRRYDERPVIAAYNLRAESEGSLQLPPLSDFVAAQVLACRALADSGPCILLDRYGSLALRGRENVINIFLHADAADRVQALAKERSISEEEAKRILKKIDRSRRSYYRSYSPDWGKTGAYTLTMDISKTRVEGAAKQILSYISDQYRLHTAL